MVNDCPLNGSADVNKYVLLRVFWSLPNVETV